MIRAVLVVGWIGVLLLLATAVTGYRVAEEPEAREHINRLNRKYHDGDEDYPVRPGEERVIFLIEPERVH